MRVSALILVLVALTTATGACTRARFRSPEGVYCSTNEDDDPYRECQRGIDLICISTHKQPRITGDPVAVYLCRTPCALMSNDCPTGNDVCCSGKTYAGGKFGTGNGCVPLTMCEGLSPPPRDAGLPLDSGAPDETGGKA